MSAGFLDQFILDEMPLLMLNQTEKLAENHGADYTVESRRQVGSHSVDGRHCFCRNSLVVDVIRLLLLRQLLHSHVVGIHDVRKPSPDNSKRDCGNAAKNERLGRRSKPELQQRAETDDCRGLNDVNFCKSRYSRDVRGVKKQISKTN